jgi:hypothetical protein
VPDVAVLCVSIEDEWLVAGSGVLPYEFVDAWTLVSVTLDSDGERVREDDSVVLVSP